MAELAIYRIIGTTVPLVHSPSIAVENIADALLAESLLPGVRRIWIENRIPASRYRTQLRELLRTVEEECIVIPFEWPARTDDGRIGISAARIYARDAAFTRVNSARNLAVGHAQMNGWASLPLDANVVVSPQVQQAALAALRSGARMLEVPLVRASGRGADQPELRVTARTYESQLVFGVDAEIRYDEEVPYGLGDKAALLQALGFCGPWSAWRSVRSVYRLEPDAVLRMNCASLLSAVARVPASRVLDSRLLVSRSRLRSGMRLLGTALRSVARLRHRPDCSVGIERFG